MSSQGSPEDILSDMFKYMGVGKGQDMSKILHTLIRNSQINMLRQLRRDIDGSIKKLATEGEDAIASDEKLDPYLVLGVDQYDTRDIIDKAYKKKASKAHPDRGGSHEEMVIVNAAYEAISQFRGWK